jgi:hypothetical protein
MTVPEAVIVVVHREILASHRRCRKIWCGISADKPSKLCPRCRVIGHATCRECALRSELGLVLGPEGVIYRVKAPPEPVIKGWYRCEECNERFRGFYRRLERRKCALSAFNRETGPKVGGLEGWRSRGQL